MEGLSPSVTVSEGRISVESMLEHHLGDLNEWVGRRIDWSSKERRPRYFDCLSTKSRGRVLHGSSSGLLNFESPGPSETGERERGTVTDSEFDRRIVLVYGERANK